MDILSKLPFLNSDDVPANIDAVTEEEAKKARIKFHRESVRNGPTKFRPVTNGQIRRAQKRDLARSSRKAFRRQVKTYLAAQREAATLRGMLQSAGVVSYAISSTQATPKAAYKAIVWILERFAEGDENGRVEVTEQVVRDSLQAALNRWETIVGLPKSALSPEYTLPVDVAA